MTAFMALLLTFTMAVQGAWAATTGIDYSKGTIEISYGNGDEVRGEWSENILTVDGKWVYCANVDAHFEEGLEVTCEDPVATGKWPQAMVTDLALASDFVWSGRFKSSTAYGDGHVVTDNREKYAVTQVLVWEILNSYGYSDYGWFGTAVDGQGLTGSDDGHADCWNYLDEQRGNYIGHADYYDGGSAQSVVCGFDLELIPRMGGIELVKRSANESITKNNSCYGLKGAVYGVFATKEQAKTHNAGEALKTYKTDADGTWKSGNEFSTGTYFVAEIEAPDGYALDTSVYKVDVPADSSALVNADMGYVSDEPKSNPVDIWAAKTDAETADGGAQGGASLAGAHFEIAYYDGYYDQENLPKKATRTWVVASGQYGIAYAHEDLKVSGDDFYYTDEGQITIPLGTVTVREISAPAGYRLDDGATEMKLIQITSDDRGKSVGAYTAPGFSDHVVRGGVIIGKIDRQNGYPQPQGAATLAGTMFSIVSLNEQPVIVEGTSYAPGDVVKTIETDDMFLARTSDDCLPAGTYLLYESAASEGYTYDEESEAWNRVFMITEDGEVIDLAFIGDVASNQVVRGDFSFEKADKNSGARLGEVVFLVTSLTTGEAHVIMTDKNGVASTAATHNAHTKKTNVNDKAVTKGDEGYLVDEAKLDATAGVWFNGSTEMSCDADDELGALPYDLYQVEELRTSANEGYDLVTFVVAIDRHAQVIDLGTVDDKAWPILETTLADEQGSHSVVAGKEVTLIDTVRYENLDAHKKHTLIGSLHLVAEDGTDDGEIATAQVTFKPDAAEGSVEVEFTIDASELAGRRVVAFERLLDKHDALIAAHADISDENQTVEFTPPPTDTPPAQTPPSKSELPRTGDGIVVVPLILVIATAIGLIVVALSTRTAQRDREIVINRGPTHTMEE